jgi:hypothetical protein
MMEPKAVGKKLTIPMPWVDEASARGKEVSEACYVGLAYLHVPNVLLLHTRTSVGRKSSVDINLVSEIF